MHMLFCVLVVWLHTWFTPESHIGYKVLTCSITILSEWAHESTLCLCVHLYRWYVLGKDYSDALSLLSLLWKTTNHLSSPSNICTHMIESVIILLQKGWRRGGGFGKTIVRPHDRNGHSRFVCLDIKRKTIFVLLSFFLSCLCPFFNLSFPPLSIQYNTFVQYIHTTPLFKWLLDHGIIC